MTYTVKIGAGGTTVKVPVNVRISKAGGNADNIEVTVDSQVIGVKLAVKGVVSHSAVRTDRYDLSRAVELSENMSDEDGRAIGLSEDMTDEDAEKLEELGEELSNKLGDFTDLIQTVANNVSGGYGLDYDDYDDYDDWDDDDWDDWDDDDDWGDDEDDDGDGGFKLGDLFGG